MVCVPGRKSVLKPNVPMKDLSTYNAVKMATNGRQPEVKVKIYSIQLFLFAKFSFVWKLVVAFCTKSPFSIRWRRQCCHPASQLLRMTRSTMKLWLNLDQGMNRLILKVTEFFRWLPFPFAVWRKGQGTSLPPSPCTMHYGGGMSGVHHGRWHVSGGDGIIMGVACQWGGDAS